MTDFLIVLLYLVFLQFKNYFKYGLNYLTRKSHLSVFMSTESKKGGVSSVRLFKCTILLQKNVEVRSEHFYV